MRRHGTSPRSLGIFGIATTLATCLIAFQGPTIALANTNCSQFPHCYSIIIDSDTQHISGVSMTANTPAMTLGDATSMNNTIWVETSNGHYPEIGLCAVNLAVGCGTDTSTNEAEYVVLDGVTTLFTQNVYTDGTNDSYTSQGTPNCGHSNDWNEYIDWVVVAVANVGACWGYANTANLGGEIFVTCGSPCAGLDSTQHTGGFIDYPYEYDSSWHSWHGHTAHIDDPCGTSNCLNGYYYSSGAYWTWNKNL